MTMLLCRDNAVYRSNSFKFERRAPEDNPKTATRFQRKEMMIQGVFSYASSSTLYPCQ